MTWWDDAVGRTHTITRVFDEGDLTAYEDLVGDVPTGRVPEPLVAGLFSRILGVDLPGAGTNYLKQDLTFSASGRPGEVLTARVEVVKVVADKRLVYLATTCTGANGRVLAAGRALVLAGGVGR